MEGDIFKVASSHAESFVS